jgi:hypothetical protein
MRRETDIARPWTPDWNQWPHESLLATKPFKATLGPQFGKSRVEDNYSASGGLDAEATFSHDLSIMTVKGVVWDRAEFVTRRIVDESPSEYISTGFRDDYLKMCDLIGKKNKTINPSERLAQGLTKTEGEVPYGLLQSVERFLSSSVPSDSSLHSQLEWRSSPFLTNVSSSLPLAT